VVATPLAVLPPALFLRSNPFTYGQEATLLRPFSFPFPFPFPYGCYAGKGRLLRSEARQEGQEATLREAKQGRKQRAGCYEGKGLLRRESKQRSEQSKEKANILTR
jgi:hypothetical protein